jgi:hypothetical protein
MTKALALHAVPARHSIGAMTIDAYDPMVAPDPQAWLALTEDERIELVTAWHEAFGPEIPRPGVHAVLHAVVETQIAEGDTLPVRQKLRRLMAQGLDRHEAIHAIGSVLIRHLNALMQRGGDDPDPNQRYFSALGRLNARKWLRSG